MGIIHNFYIKFSKGFYALGLSATFIIFIIFLKLYRYAALNLHIFNTVTYLHFSYTYIYKIVICACAIVTKIGGLKGS